jgi:hypothetical protein
MSPGHLVQDVFQEAYCRQGKSHVRAWFHRGAVPMRMLRFRVRTLLAVVGLVALFVWAAMMGSRSYDYYRRASKYGLEERVWRESTARGDWRREIGSECADYFAQLAGKYRRAMWRPWMPVAPDPHAPGFDQWWKEQESRAKEVAPDPPPPGLPPAQSQ